MSFKNILKKILIGRDLQIIDKVLFNLSKGNYSGWVLGNKLRNIAYGRKKYVSKEPVILIGGFPRSGTTLLKSLLEQHPNIASPEAEVHILQDIRDKNKLKKEEKSKFKNKGFMFSEEEIKELNLGGDLIKDAESIIQEYKEKNNVERILLKQPKHVLFLKQIFKYFPNARFIHIIRNGEDATMSERYSFGKKDVHPFDWCCRQWVTYVKRGRKFKGDPRYKEVFFENFLKRPNEELNNIIDFLNLEKIKKIKTDPDNEYSSHPNVGKPISTKTIGKWKKKMSEDEEEIFNRIAGKLQKKLDKEKNSQFKKRYKN